MCACVVSALNGYVHKVGSEWVNGSPDGCRAPNNPWFFEMVAAGRGSQFVKDNESTVPDIGDFFYSSPDLLSVFGKDGDLKLVNPAWHIVAAGEGTPCCGGRGYGEDSSERNSAPHQAFQQALHGGSLDWIEAREGFVEQQYFRIRCHRSRDERAP